MATKNEKAANNEADANVKNEKIKTEEEMTTNKETSGTGPENMPCTLMAMEITIPLAVPAYSGFTSSRGKKRDMTYVVVNVMPSIIIRIKSSITVV